MSRPRVIAIVGPTASGKTGVAVEVARRIPVEVVSADSRQVRSGMRIGTAMPTAEELAEVRHHLVEVVAPDAPWNLQRWLAAARLAITEIHARGAVPLLVGGTGQYVWALLECWDVPAVEPSVEFRADLEALAAAGEGHELYSRLAALDPASAARIDPRNVRRVIRALEIIEATGAPVEPLRRSDPGFDWHAVGIRWTREQIHARADTRVDAMFAEGLIDEVRGLVEAHGRDFDALHSIGYREALAVLDGESTIDEAIRRTQIETHRLIRMQANWFRDDDPRIQWARGDYPDEVVAAVVTASAAT